MDELLPTEYILLQIAKEVQVIALHVPQADLTATDGLLPTQEGIVVLPEPHLPTEPTQAVALRLPAEQGRSTVVVDLQLEVVV